VFPGTATDHQNPHYRKNLPLQEVCTEQWFNLDYFVDVEGECA
jgi:hypothetical protein